MSVFSVCAVGVIGALLAVTVRGIRPEFALLISLITGAFILFGITKDLGGVLAEFERIAEEYGVGGQYIKIAFKICTTAYISEFAKQLCGDANESAIGVKIELFAKISVIIMALPMIAEFLNTLSEILEKI